MKLIKFEQESCRPCVALKNMLEHEFEVKVDEVVNLSTGGDEAIEKASEYGIMQTPVLLLVDDNGKELDRFSGAGEDGVRAILEKRGLI